MRGHHAWPSPASRRRDDLIACLDRSEPSIELRPAEGAAVPESDAAARALLLWGRQHARENRDYREYRSDVRSRSSSWVRLRRYLPVFCLLAWALLIFAARSLLIPLSRSASYVFGFFTERPGFFVPGIARSLVVRERVRQRVEPSLVRAPEPVPD